MTETRTAPEVAAPAAPGLPARVIGTFFSPRETYAAVVARPRWFGALAIVAVVFAVCQFAFLSTDIGQELMLEQQVRAMESFGMTVSDEAYAQLAARVGQARFVNPIATALTLPLTNALGAGICLVVFTMLLGGDGTFRQIYALLAHASLIIAFQQLFVVPLSYAAETMAGANLALLVPMLAETHIVTLFLGTLDLFVFWWLISLAIGLGVLYRRRTGPIASGLIALYVLIALVVAVIRA